MNELALFAGAGGGLLASKWLIGFRTVCYVEHNDYCIRVIQQRIKDGLLDDAPIWDDARTFDGKQWRGVVDIVTAGFPCQPFSVGGKQQSDSDERNMWPETARILGEVRPRMALLENVPGLLSVDGRDGRKYAGRVFGDLAEMGFDSTWGVVGGCTHGSPHPRERLWIIAYTEGQGLDGNNEILGVQKRQGLGICSWWNSEPTIQRVDDGVANRVERLKAIGNGQVPIVAASAWKMLTEDLWANGNGHC